MSEKSADGYPKTHTPGPWEVVIDKRPHCLGGFHTERRIFTAWNHPQVKGPVGVVNMSVGIPEVKGEAPYHMVYMSAEDAALISAAPDLLHALQMMLIEPGEWIDEARAAIKKAKTIT